MAKKKTEDADSRELWAKGHLDAAATVARNANRDGNMVLEQRAHGIMDEMLDHLKDMGRLGS